MRRVAMIAGFCLALVPAASPAAALSVEKIEIGERISLRSEVLNEERSLLAHLPESYASSSFRYPVLYLLDGASDFLHTVGVVDFLAGTDQIPEMIVIRVANTVRSRDLTPPSGDTDETAFWPAVGGAEIFRQFFKTELLPFIDREYRTAPYRIIRGQSFGGLFAVHDYMSSDPTFDAYLTTSPGVGWNFDELIKRAPEFFAEGVPMPLYIGAAGRDLPGNLEGIRAFADVLNSMHADDAQWRYDFFESESHYSLSHRATYRALEFLYGDWQVPDAIADKAQFADYESHYARLSTKYGYRIRIPMRSVIRLGNQLLRDKRYDEGIEVLKRNLDLYPTQPESHWHVGEGYVLSGRLEEARPYLEAALKAAREMRVADVADYEESLADLRSKLARD